MNHDVHLPRPSVWPATTGAGATLIGLGAASGSLYVAAAGAVIFGLGIVGWIRELRHA